MRKFTSKKVKERASANNVTEINDFDMTDIIENVQLNIFYLTNKYLHGELEDDYFEDLN